MSRLTYRRLFDPDHKFPSDPGDVGSVADRAPPDAYLFDEKTVLAVNVAAATGRPLILRGSSGLGKSSLARAVAWRMGWSYVQLTVTSRTLASDFLYQVDELKRLRDAQANKNVDNFEHYVNPGPLCWAFSPSDADEILATSKRSNQRPPGVLASATRTVVLLDEIDKADPDVPNNLLEPLGRLSFSIPELGRRIQADERMPPLIVLTTNEERDLPDAFLRRCVEYRIEQPDADILRMIGRRHFPDLTPSEHDLVMSLKPPSTAEYLDAIRACRQLREASADLGTLKSIIERVIVKAERAVG